MRISDLLACDVYDHTGAHLGRVRDVRLVEDGPLLGQVRAALRVDAVIVGGAALAGRLGYLRGGVRGPAPLAALMRRLESRARTIDAADIVVWDDVERRLVVGTAAGAVHGDEDG